MLSSVQWQRIQAADVSREQCEVRLEEVTGDWKEAQKVLKERQDAMFEGMKAARGEMVEGVLPKKTTASIFGLEGDYEKALNAWELLDREKRKQGDLTKKLTVRVLALLKEAREGPDLYTAAENAKRGPEDAQAFRMVLLDDILDPGYSAPFRENGVVTVNDFLALHADDTLGTLTSQHKINKTAVAYAHARLAENLKALGIQDKKVKAFIEDAPRAPKLDKLETPKAQAKAPADEEGQGETGDAAPDLHAIRASGGAPWAGAGKPYGDKGSRIISHKEAVETGMVLPDAKGPKDAKPEKKSRKAATSEKPKKRGNPIKHALSDPLRK